eukprot:CAMPEP_0178960644 /NCGR_PEP_ID=MMETSP0789-20121207/13089_1 /TAXON_ID=3005 /ORGANISM="Rhizosolenia setigera, Strain CCMP 1694" /LENGTH=272 /DNA_ID=CAMNT_0020644037 /DNA_START=40 /DNA_END=858 /DNA_ORIENTATION=+
MKPATALLSIMASNSFVFGANEEYEYSTTSNTLIAKPRLLFDKIKTLIRDDDLCCCCSNNGDDAADDSEDTDTNNDDDVDGNSGNDDNGIEADDGSDSTTVDTPAPTSEPTSEPTSRSSFLDNIMLLIYNTFSATIDTTAQYCTWDGVDSCDSDSIEPLDINIDADAHFPIDGSLPSELGLLTELTQLYLAYHSDLVNTIPSELGLLTNLKNLHLEELSITGSIPVELDNLGALTRLDLNTNNGLTGTVPTTLCSATNLNLRVPSPLSATCN